MPVWYSNRKISVWYSIENLIENPYRRQTHKDKKKCIFHLENKSDEEAKIFKIEFWKELERMEEDKGVKGFFLKR